MRRMVDSVEFDAQRDAGNETAQGGTGGSDSGFGQQRAWTRTILERLTQLQLYNAAQLANTQKCLSA